MSSDIPTLILTGGFDPVTPYSWGQALSGDLVNAIHVHISNVSHGVLGDSRCAREIAADFLDDPSINLDLGCVETDQIPPLEFITE